MSYFLLETSWEKKFPPQLPLQEQAPPCCYVYSESAAGGAVMEHWFPAWSARCPSLWCHFPTDAKAAEQQTAADWKDNNR